MAVGDGRTDWGFTSFPLGLNTFVLVFLKKSLFVPELCPDPTLLHLTCVEDRKL